jgi:hypothetical protein
MNSDNNTKKKGFDEDERKRIECDNNIKSIINQWIM